LMDDIWHRRLEAFIDLDEDGKVAIEYGLIAALIALAIVGALANVRSTIEAPLNTVAQTLDEAGSGN
jgi:pilus assembly protein Flp/PilA